LAQAKIIEELQKQQRPCVTFAPMLAVGFLFACSDKLPLSLASHVLMCGDGGNDVGALKQADDGVHVAGFPLWITVVFSWLVSNESSLT